MFIATYLNNNISGLKSACSGSLSQIFYFSIVTYFRVKQGLILVYLIVILNITFMANKIIEVHSKSGQRINYKRLTFHCVEC